MAKSGSIAGAVPPWRRSLRDSSTAGRESRGGFSRGLACAARALMLSGTRMNVRSLLPLFLVAGAAFASAADRPNILYILCDDLGWGDVKALNAESKIATPSFDRLAAAGITFTDAHSSSAVCTPTRYGILTGRYNWRSRLQSGVLGGLSPHLIDPGRMTVASLLRQNGYHTACIGKWHLGMDWKIKEPAYKPADDIEKGPDGWKIDWTKPATNGPNAVGFEYYFGISASLDMLPYTFIENDHVTEVPTVERQFPMMAGREGAKTRLGAGAPDFEATDVLPTLTRKAIEFVDQQKPGAPFFLYLPLNAPHTPIAPTKEWLGKSGLNPYADFVMEVDDCVGRILAALEKKGLTRDTLVILTSDNGCSPQAKFEELQAKGHFPSGPLRGHKADIFDGGHRIPFIASWPAKIAPGSQSDQLICLTDLLATAAEIIGAQLPPTAGEDSVSILPALLGTAKGPLREAVVHHSINGSFAIRQGPWKLELCPDSGGWSKPRPGTAAAKGLPPNQLYNLTQDIGERSNLFPGDAATSERLESLLKKYISDGRSTPGPAQHNDVEIQLRKTTFTKAKE
jgi:arylsulfatase A-like enzyme